MNVVGFIGHMVCDLRKYLLICLKITQLVYSLKVLLEIFSADVTSSGHSVLFPLHQPTEWIGLPSHLRLIHLRMPLIHYDLQGCDSFFGGD